MKSFPIINNALISACFDKVRALYHLDKIKLLNAAEKSTKNDQNPISVLAHNIDSQIDVIKTRVLRTADNYGQQLLIKWIEELYDDLTNVGAIGVTDKDFLESTKITLEDKSQIRYDNNRKWSWSWELEVDGNKRTVEMGIRGKKLHISVIVQDYVLQYVQQAMIAFSFKRPAASLALMTIAMEGTLRDALHSKGYTYQFGSPSQDVYEIQDMHIHKDTGGYKVTFPNPMPSSPSQFLSAVGDPAYRTFRIKRTIKGSNLSLEIRQAADLIDFWSSDKVITPGTMQISGLGAAIDIGRNQAKIITANELPEDLDKPIQTVRNNLIHLSGNAMNENVQIDSLGRPVSLGDFLNNKNRVFDAVCTIGDTINIIYDKMASNTL